MLFRSEMDLRNERAMNACVKVANFPYIKTFEDFDFSYQPSINKDEIIDFRNLRFMEKKENILLIGTPVVGKTHLETDIGIEAAKNRNSTYFINCNDLVLQLKRAHLENRLETRLKFFAKYKLLIIDEVGFLPLDSESSNLLFQLITKRGGKRASVSRSGGHLVTAWMGKGLFLLQKAPWGGGGRARGPPPGTPAAGGRARGWGAPPPAPG